MRGEDGVVLLLCSPMDAHIVPYMYKDAYVTVVAGGCSLLYPHIAVHSV